MASLWDRRDDENNLWFDRFDRYRLMGATRSILGCYNAERAENGQHKVTDIPGAWRKASKLYLWKDRAAAWDASLRAEAEKELVADKQVAKERRQASIAALDNILGYLTGFYEQRIKQKAEQGPMAESSEPVISPFEAARLANALRVSLEQSRIEMGEPATINGVSGPDGGPVQHQEQALKDISEEQRSSIVEMWARRKGIIT